MNNQKRITKIITSIILAVLVFLNLNLNYNVKNVNAKDNSKNVETTSNDEISSKEVSKVSSPDEGSIKESNGKKYVDNDVLLFFKDGVTKEKVNEVVNYVNGSIIGEITTLNEYQVQVKESTLEELNNIVQDIMNKYSNYIAYASVDYISENSSIEPSDPWGNNSNWNESDVSGENWGLKAIDAQSACQYNNIFDESVNKVNVGIVDGGFDTNGEDFPDNYEKYCDSDYGYLTLSGLTKGVTDVLSNGANVVNCSFSGGEKTESTVAAIIMAKMISLGHDFVIIQASGNASVDASYSSWFAGIDDTELKIASNLYGVNVNDIKDRIIIAGAAELHDDGSYMQAEYSNGGDKVNICAPGSNIFSSKAGNNYVTGDGTSYAAPHVAGVVELTWRANPNLTGAEVRNIVCNYENTTYDVPDNPNSSDTRGDYRMVNAKLSVESALKTRDDLVTIYYNSDSDCNIKYTLEGKDSDETKTVLMNNNLDNNGYNKSITVPTDGSSYILAEFGNKTNLDNNSGDYYKLEPGAYEIHNGTITKVNDKFSALKFNSFKIDEGSETSLGDCVNLSARAKDTVGDVQYKFSVVDENGNEVSNEKSFKVIEAPKIDSYSISPKSYGGVGRNLSFYCSILGGKTPYISSKIIAQGGNYPYGEQIKYFNMHNYDSGDWTPDMEGTYKIFVDLTDGSGVTRRLFVCNYEVKKDASYPVTISSFNASKTSNIEVGEEILLNYSVLGGMDADGYKWTIITAKNEDGTEEEIATTNSYSNLLNSVKWAPTKAGKWTITLKADDDNGDVAINIL